MTQNDLKRVLAYSTISQLGYMFLSLGLGCVAGHRVRDVPFVHACVFQSAAVPRRRQRDARDGGHRRYAAIQRSARTHAGHIAGHFWSAVWRWRALTPFAGFWSKDGILATCYSARPNRGKRCRRQHGVRHRGSAAKVCFIRPCFGSPRHRGPDGVLHVSGVFHDVLRRRAHSGRSRASCP